MKLQLFLSELALKYKIVGRELTVLKKVYRQIKNRRGNVTIMWVDGLPAFIILLMFIGTFVAAWMTHSASQVAADASSLAETEGRS